MCQHQCEKDDYFCRSEEGRGSEECKRQCEAQCKCRDTCEPLMEDAAQCALSGGRWVNADMTFDWILEGIKTLFQITTTEGWIVLMLGSIDSRGPYFGPYVNYEEHWILYYFFYTLVGTFFIANLCIGVIIDNFNQMKKD